MNVGSISESMPVSPLVSSQGSSVAQHALISTPVTKGDAPRREEPSLAEIKRMAQEMRRQIESMNVNLKFTTYGEHGERIAIVVMNEDTGEVIREIPPKEIQALYERMSELVGMIFNRNV